MVSIEQLVSHQDFETVSLPPHSTVAEAARIMTQNQWDMVTVCSDNSQLLGVISWRDIIRAIADISGDISAFKVSQLFSQNALTCSLEDDVHDVMLLMEKHHIHHMPVIQNGKLVGLVRYSEILFSMMEESDMDKRAALIANLKYL